jgi:hypothetical protein
LLEEAVDERGIARLGFVVTFQCVLRIKSGVLPDVLDVDGGFGGYGGTLSLCSENVGAETRRGMVGAPL